MREERNSDREREVTQQTRDAAELTDLKERVLRLQEENRKLQSKVRAGTMSWLCCPTLHTVQSNELRQFSVVLQTILFSLIVYHFELLILLLKCHALYSTLQSESKKKGSSSDDREESDEDPRKRKEVIESERALKIEVESLQVI